MKKEKEYKLKISLSMGTRNKKEKGSRACRHVCIFIHSFRLLTTTLMLVTSLVAKAHTPKF